MPVYLPGLTFGGLGYGGASYGYSPYGSPAFPRLPVATTGGYGGAPYGYASYGSVDITPPEVTGANALDGFRVEIFFDEEMKSNAALVTSTNYVFSAIFGVPLTAVSVLPGAPGILGGYTSVIVTHTGSTLGGQYQVVTSNVEDVSGNVIVYSPALFSAFGDNTLVLVSIPIPDDGRTVQLDFIDTRAIPQDLLTEAQFSPGVEDVISYDLSTTYPVPPTLSDPDQNALILSRVTLDVHPMTSAIYTLVVGPSLAYTYDGTVLPDDDPNLSGIETGTGTSVATASNGLLISKVSPNTYGWEFGDITGRLTPGTTFRADFTIDVTGTTITPAVFNSTLCTLSVCDGAVQINLSLEDVAGVKVIGITSGVFITQVPASWDLAEFTLTLIRNQKGAFYTLLLDGVPLLTIPLASPNGAPIIPAGTSIFFPSTHNVAIFKLLSIGLTASSTIFTSSWNFIHGLATTFTGSSALARDRIYTKRGPLVRGWGDATPAMKEDVAVRVNSVDVDVAGVNPYVGEIYPLIPIPRADPGIVDVEIDYIWFTNPPFPLVGLNTRGLSLNVWDRSSGHTPGALSPLPNTSIGAIKGNRFPMGIALAPYTRPSPKAIGHRYIGFQKDYSALLNSPTTLLLNQNPHAISIGGMTASSIAQSGSFNGQTLPGQAATPWTLSGVDSGGVVGDGTYRLIDSSTGPYGIGTATIYERDVDLSLPTFVLESARFKVESFTPDGVFTGVGFGLHDGLRLLLVGALLVDGVQHIGVLTDGTKSYLEEGWQIGPSAEATATSQTTIVLSIASLPPGVESGSRFRIASGTQAGVYTIASCGISTNADGSTVTITIDPALPADTTQFGNNTFTVLFETPWSEDLISLRVQAEYPTGSAQVFLGGSVSGLVADISVLAPYPAQTALLIPATEKGVVFWGSISRRAENHSIWDFSQYASNPERLTQTVQGITAQTEMNVLPQDDPNDPWYIVGGFGYAEVGASDTVLLKSTSASVDGSIDLEFSYERVEPFLTNRVNTDTEAKFQVDSGILGAGDARITIGDGVREVIFNTLLYTESAVERKLVTDLPQVSISGLQDPVTQGWTKVSGNTVPSPYVQGQTLEFTKTPTQNGLWTKSLAVPTLAKYEGLIAESRFKVTARTFGSVGIGWVFGAQVPISLSNQRTVGLVPTATGLRLVNASGGTVGAVSFTWDDGEFHTFRLLCDPVADIVVVVADGTVLGSAALSSFGFSNPGSSVGLIGGLGTGSCSITLDSMSVIPLRPVALSGSTLGRTFGILLRGKDPDDIDSYRIPRTDGTAAPNSSTTFALVVPMDWQSLCHVRLYLDHNWGVSFYRPDLPLPPYYTGDFVTESTDPTAAWATVEYRDLPVVDRVRGAVSFGASDPRSITQQRWDFMRYRIRGALDGFGIAPQGMVLNRSFTFTSGEWNVDVTPEVLTIDSQTSTLVKISDSAIYADRVFVVQVDGVVRPAATWSFDPATQYLTLNQPLPATQYPVTVTFAPGQPVTKQYLCTQPFSGSVTVLNEGTPPVPASLNQPPTSAVVFGSAINDPEDILDSAESLILNDPYKFVKFTDGSDSLYASTEFCEVDDGEEVHISTLCDGPGPGEGLAALAIEGQMTSDFESLPEGPAGPWGKQSPMIKGSATHFSPTSILIASGGHVVGGVLGPGTAILYPNARGPSGLPPEGGMGMNQDFRLILRETSPRTDTIDIPTLLGDNVPPSSADPETDPNPDGTPGVAGHGAAAYTMVDWGATTYSKIGPWGGLAVLSTNSLLAGGAQLTGTEFILQGGAQLTPPVTTSGVIEAAN